MIESTVDWTRHINVIHFSSNLCFKIFTPRPSEVNFFLVDLFICRDMQPLTKVHKCRFIFNGSRAQNVGASKLAYTS